MNRKPFEPLKATIGIHEPYAVHITQANAAIAQDKAAADQAMQGIIDINRKVINDIKAERDALRAENEKLKIDYDELDEANIYLGDRLARAEEILRLLAPGLKVSKFDTFGDEEVKDCLYVTPETELARDYFAKKGET